VSRLLRALLGYVVLIALVATLYRSPVLLLAVLLAQSGLTLAWFGPRATWRSWVVGAVLGPVGEAVAVWCGAWAYWGTGGLPVWLPAGWGLASVYLMAIVRDLDGRASR